MSASPFDSAIYRDLFHDHELASLFTDEAEIRAMLLVEGELALAQAAEGLIPEIAARAIHRASREARIDPADLTEETGSDAVPVPALVKAFRKAVGSSRHARYVHWGATSQDIMETGLVLRLRQALAIYEFRLESLSRKLARLASDHAELPMAARTYGQTATVTSFGAVVTGWGRPLLRHLERLDRIRDESLCVSLSGAAGTLSAMGDRGPAVRTRLAGALGLGDPGGSWHSERDRIGALASWITGVATSLGKMGEDLILLTQSGVSEIVLARAGGSSTMPQKSNPVIPSLLVALARHITALNVGLQGAGLHRQQRDGAAWLTEWLALPQLCIGLGRSLSAAGDLISGVTPDPEAMERGIDDGTGLVYAEALSFALAATMPRPDAQESVKELCVEARRTGAFLPDLAVTEWPGLDRSLFTPARQLGTAPDEARAFARSVRERRTGTGQRLPEET